MTWINSDSFNFLGSLSALNKEDGNRLIGLRLSFSDGERLGIKKWDNDPSELNRIFTSEIENHQPALRNALMLFIDMQPCERVWRVIVCDPCVKSVQDGNCVPEVNIREPIDPELLEPGAGIVADATTHPHAIFYDQLMDGRAFDHARHQIEIANYYRALEDIKQHEILHVSKDAVTGEICVSKTPLPATCSCENQDLFNHGCRCGHLKKD